MSSKKITDADKLEILDLYRQSGETTSSLASRYGVSNSTISRLLKTSIPEAEYEILIQKKRGGKTSNDEENSSATDELTIADTPTIRLEVAEIQPEPDEVDAVPIAVTVAAENLAPEPEETSTANSRRSRRRSSAQIAADNALKSDLAQPVSAVSIDPIAESNENLDRSVIELPQKAIVPAPVPRPQVLTEILADSQDRYFAPPVVPQPAVIGADDGEEDPEDVNALAAMFGEEIADGDDGDDGDDDDDFAEEEWDDETGSNYQQIERDRLLTTDRSHIRVTPLSQATLPRTCYIVVDKFAELIVRPLKDFADLGQIPIDEIQQRTLPVFDNHRVAKRFSNQRTQRVIKVPDSRVFHKTIQHLRLKGISCLLVDGNIYSLN